MAAKKKESEGFHTSLLTCSICYQLYQSPKVLPCLHTFCYSCLSRHFVLTVEKDPDNMQCPKCNSVVLLPIYAKGVESLRDDNSVSRMKELFEQLSIHVVTGDSNNVQSEDNSKGSNNSVGKVGDKNFFKHVKRKEDMQKTLDSLKEHTVPMSGYLVDLYYSYHYAKANWKDRLRQHQKVFVTDPEIVHVAESEEITARNQRKEDIQVKFKPVIEWITTEKNVLHEKLAEVRAISEVTKEVLRKATLKQLEKCGGKLDHLLHTALNIAKTSQSRKDKPPEFDKLTEKREATKIESNVSSESGDAKELIKALADLKLNSTDDDPRNISVNLVVKISGKGGGPGKFSSPKSAAFAPNGDVMIADTNNFRVQVFDRSGQVKGELFKGRVKPNNVCINPKSYTFYVDDDNSEMLKVFTADGVCETGKVGGCYWSKGLIFHGFNSSGDIVMSHPSKCSITVHDRTTGEILQDFFFNYFEEVAPEYNPHFVAITKENRVLISEAKSNHVQVFSEQGRYLYNIPNLLVPRGVCSDAYGNIFVAEGDAHRIAMFNRYGKLVRYLLAEKDGIRYPMALAVDDSGLLVVTQYGMYMPHEVLFFQLQYKKETLL